MTDSKTNPSARRGHQIAGRRALGLALLASATFAGAVQAQTPTDLRENAVRVAQSGKMAEAQATLRTLLVVGPDDGLVAMDLVTLLEQDGKSVEAVAIFARADKPDAPDYALQAAVRANQNIGRQDEARRLIGEGKRRFSNDPTWAVLEKRVVANPPAK